VLATQLKGVWRVTIALCRDPYGSPGPFLGIACDQFGAQMACKQCASEKLQVLTGELSASPRYAQSASIPPVYVCQEVMVCLQCGFAELIIPTAELDQLRAQAEQISK
jgi:hypothetical protein